MQTIRKSCATNVNEIRQTRTDSKLKWYSKMAAGGNIPPETTETGVSVVHHLHKLVRMRAASVAHAAGHCELEQ